MAAEYMASWGGECTLVEFLSMDISYDFIFPITLVSRTVFVGVVKLTTVIRDLIFWHHAATSRID